MLCIFTQFTSWQDLRDRVKGLGPKKVAQLELMGFDITPTIEGLLRDLMLLSAEALAARGVSEASCSRISEVREGRKEGKPLPSAGRAKRLLTAAVWREALEKLLGTELWAPDLELQQMPVPCAKNSKEGLPGGDADGGDSAGSSSPVVLPPGQGIDLASEQRIGAGGAGETRNKPAVLLLPAVMKKEELAGEPPLKDKPFLHGGESGDDGDGDDDKIGAMWPSDVLRDLKEGLGPDEYVRKDEPEASADGSGPGKQDWWWLGLDDNGGGWAWMTMVVAGPGRQCPVSARVQVRQRLDVTTFAGP